MNTIQTDRLIREQRLKRAEVLRTVRGIMPVWDRRLRYLRLVFVVAAILSFAIARIGAPTMGSGAVAGPALGFMGPVAIVLMFAALFAHKRYIWVQNDLRPFALRLHGFCTCCGYPLGGLAPERGGCTVCPECGAAWRLPIRGRMTDA